MLTWQHYLPQLIDTWTYSGAGMSPKTRKWVSILALLVPSSQIPGALYCSLVDVNFKSWSDPAVEWFITNVVASYLTQGCHCGGRRRRTLTWWTRVVWPVISTLLWLDRSIRCRADWSPPLSHNPPPPQSPQKSQSTCKKKGSRQGGDEEERTTQLKQLQKHKHGMSMFELKGSLQKWRDTVSI